MKTELELRMLFWDEADAYHREDEYADMKPYMTEDKFVEVVKQLQLESQQEKIAYIGGMINHQKTTRIAEIVNEIEKQHGKILVIAGGETPSFLLPQSAPILYHARPDLLNMEPLIPNVTESEKQRIRAQKQ